MFKVDESYDNPLMPLTPSGGGEPAAYLKSISKDMANLEVKITNKSGTETKFPFEIKAGNTLPSGEYAGQWFYLNVDVGTTKAGLYRFNGNLWELKANVSSGTGGTVSWGEVSGDIENQTDLIQFLEDNYVDKTDIVDALNSTDTDKPLSANQGKVLNDTKESIIQGDTTPKTKQQFLDMMGANKIGIIRTAYFVADESPTGSAGNSFTLEVSHWNSTYAYIKATRVTTNAVYMCWRTSATTWTNWEKIATSKSDVGLSEVVNTGDSATPVSGGTTKFTTGGAYTELAKKLDNFSSNNSIWLGTEAMNYNINLAGNANVVKDLPRSYRVGTLTATVSTFRAVGKWTESGSLINGLYGELTSECYADMSYGDNKSMLQIVQTFKPFAASSAATYQRISNQLIISDGTKSGALLAKTNYSSLTWSAWQKNAVADDASSTSIASGISCWKKNGIVSIIFNTCSISAGSGVIIGTVPEGFRKSGSFVGGTISTSAGNTNCLIWINTSGAIQAYANTAGQYFGTITYAL